MNDSSNQPTITQTRADVLYIGYPKAASTFVHRYLDNHPEVTTDHNCLAPLLMSPPAPATVTEKPYPDKVHVSREESVAESVCVVGDGEMWRRYKYVPGEWDRIKNDIKVDAGEAASRLHKVQPGAKVLLLIREQADWLQSVYKYVMPRLPASQRSFADYCSTPSGVVFLQAGHFDQTIRAYVDVFGSDRVHVLRYEDIATEPRRFAADLCASIGVSARPIPQQRENETNVQIARIQRFFPIVDRLPGSLKSALKPHAARLLPGGRGAMLSRRDIRILRGIYAASNQRTEKLIARLPTRAR